MPSSCGRTDHWLISSFQRYRGVDVGRTGSVTTDSHLGTENLVDHTGPGTRDDNDPTTSPPSKGLTHSSPPASTAGWAGPATQAAASLAVAPVPEAATRAEAGPTAASSLRFR